MKPKICFIVSSPLTAKSFLEKHFILLSQKFDITLIANLIDDELIKYKNPYLFETKHIRIKRKINIFFDIVSFIELFFYLNSRKFAAIITLTPKASLLGILTAYLSRIPKRIQIFTGQVWHTKGILFKFFYILIDKITIYLSTQSIVDGNPQLNFLISNNIINKDKSITIGKGTIGGVDINKFKPDQIIRKKLRSEFNFSDKDIVFLYLGRLNKDKGIFDLLNAFMLLTQINIKLLIVGPDEENINYIVKSKYNSSKIIIQGPTDLAHEIMQVCDIFCLPSHREAFGLSIIEASSCEKAIICSDTYGLADTIVENITGLKHITKDINSLSNKMSILIEDNDLRERLGKNGRKYVVDNFSSNLITNLWLDYFVNELFKDYSFSN